MELSVIIPTYNRHNLLLQSLQSLQEQSFTGFEIVVVDNAADNKMAESLKDFNRTAKVPIRYVPEPSLGAHHARHTGARIAKNEVLLFTDDDQTFDPGWTGAYERAFAEHQRLMAAGGPIRPRWESSPPRWLMDFMRGRTLFPILSLIELLKEFNLDNNGVFFSGNMAIRRTALFELGGFGPDLCGNQLLGNGETGLNHKLRERGLLIGYVPEAITYHHISPERMTVEYFRRRMANEGFCDMYTRFHRHMPGQFGLVACAISVTLLNCIGWLIAPLLSGRTDRLSLQVQLQASRSRAQVIYIIRLIKDKELRKFVLKQDWLNAACTSP
jgi:glycosyltransferase involved in cell wall biosynthesis